MGSMKKPNFEINDFFGSGHFYDPWDLKNDQKKTGAKKVENHFFHARQPRKEFF